MVSILNFGKYPQFLLFLEKGENTSFCLLILSLANVTYFGQCTVKKRDMSRSFLCVLVILLGSCAFCSQPSKGHDLGSQVAVDPRRISRHR